MTRDCDTVAFFPTIIPFPEVKLQDYLCQAAGNIISILTLTPASTITPSLEAGNPVRSALVTLATQLYRIERISESLHTYNSASPRVEPPTLTKHTSLSAPAPRVVVHQSLNQSPPPASVVQTHNKESKNISFNNKSPHRYPLRSKARPTKYNLKPASYAAETNYKDTTARVLLAQHIF